MTVVSIGREILSIVNAKAEDCVRCVIKSIISSTDIAERERLTVPSDKPLGSLCHLSIAIEDIAIRDGVHTTGRV